MSTVRSWPKAAQDIVLEAARNYYQQMKESHPVPEAAMKRTVAWANDELVAREVEIREEATDRWIDRWGRGLLDKDMEKAILKIYQRLNRAEGITRPRAASSKSPRQLDAEIAQVLSEKGHR